MKYELKTAIDDDILSMILQYSAQSYHMICRQYGYSCELSDIEIAYLKGIQFWTAYLKKFHIDFVVFFVIPHEGNDFVLYQVCKALKIQTVIASYSLLLSNCYYIQNIEDDILDLVEYYNELKRKYENKPIDEVILSEGYAELFEKLYNKEEDLTPWYMQDDFRWPLFLELYFSRIVSCHRRVQKSRQNHTHDASLKSYCGEFLYKALLVDKKLTKGSVSRKILSIWNNDYKTRSKVLSYYKKNCQAFDKSLNYIYFPLQFQPECTSNPQGGGMYYNQIIPLRILSECLPEDVFIYVKEHPTQYYGTAQKSFPRTESFYEELLSIPKVRFVDLDTNTYELIQNSIAVSTLTGTAGLEGLFFGKPFIMFGHSPIKHMPGVYHVRSILDCKNVVDLIIKGQTNFTMKDIKLYFLAMSETEGLHLAGGEEAAEPTEEEMEKQVESNFLLVEKILKKS